MYKFIIVSLAVAGAFLLLPAFWPSLNHIAFNLKGYAVSWSIILTVMVLFMGMKLKASD